MFIPPSFSVCPLCDGPMDRFPRLIPAKIQTFTVPAKRIGGRFVSGQTRTITLPVAAHYNGRGPQCCSRCRSKKVIDRVDRWRALNPEAKPFEDNKYRNSPHGKIMRGTWVENNHDRVLEYNRASKARIRERTPPTIKTCVVLFCKNTFIVKGRGSNRQLCDQCRLESRSYRSARSA